MHLRVNNQLNLIGATLNDTIRHSLTLQERIRNTALSDTLTTVPNTTRSNKVRHGGGRVQLNLTAIDSTNTCRLILQIVGLDNLLIIQRVNICCEVRTNVTRVLSNRIIPGNADDTAVRRVVRQGTNLLAACVKNIYHLGSKQKITGVFLTFGASRQSGDKLNFGSLPSLERTVKVRDSEGYLTGHATTTIREGLNGTFATSHLKG